MEEDLDYYLAMEEDAQQEEEDWGEDGEMDIQHQLAAPSSIQVASDGAAPISVPTVPSVISPSATSTVSRPAATTSFSAPVNVAK